MQRDPLRLEIFHGFHSTPWVLISVRRSTWTTQVIGNSWKFGAIIEWHCWPPQKSPFIAWPVSTLDCQGTRNCTKRRGVVAPCHGYHPHPNSSNSQLHLNHDPSLQSSHHRKHHTRRADTKYPRSVIQAHHSSPFLLLPPSPTPLPISSPLWFTVFFHCRHHHLSFLPATKNFC